ncbi:hypothetical protein [Streptococcus equi]|nr:hypothetical protein [Streptococcus equi]
MSKIETMQNEQLMHDPETGEIIDAEVVEADLKESDMEEPF